MRTSTKLTLLALNLMICTTLTFPPQDCYAATQVTPVAVPSGGKAIAAKTDSQGIIHLVFDSADGPQYANSKDNGKTISKPLPLVDKGSQKPGLEFITWDMAVSPDGAVHIVLGNNAW